MVFSSLVFLFVYLPIFLVCYWLLPKNGIYRNLFFVLASLVFYFWGEQGFILVLLFSILLNYVIGLLIGQDNPQTKKAVLFIGVFVNLLILGYFKYALFVADNFSWFLSENWKETSFGNHLQDVYLPLGISFFTFQGISYLVDIYRKQAPVEKSLLNLSCYISMFPQLVAGPIVRYQTISEQIKKRQLTKEKISLGIQLFCIGLSYKVLLANSLASPVDFIFDLPLDQLTPSLAWAASLGYTFQIYFDFCGYSSMAIGLGLMMGFHLPYNFNFPYISSSITEFWRRWHITLSQWFRDYLYIPLGGNRKGRGQTFVNLILVFVLCGLWHGAAWKFLFWGLYHGFFLVIERLGFKKVLDKLPKPIGVFYMFFVVLFGWVLFRANSMNQAMEFFKTMFGFSSDAVKYWSFSELISPIFIIALFSSILFSSHLINKIFFERSMHSKTISSLNTLPKIRFQAFWYAGVTLFFVLSCILLLTQTYNPFIYFRF